MSADKFLQTILPATGPYCIAIPFQFTDKEGKSRSAYRHHAFDTTDDAAAFALKQSDKDVFFAIGALKKRQEWDEKRARWRTSRATENIRGLRAYVIDIDIRPDAKHYATLQEAVVALKQFVQKCKLPVPYIVHSGGGMHVYFLLDEEVEPDEWKANGELLQQLFLLHDFKADPARTADPAGVLRVVGTFNHKDTTPRPVHVLKESGVRVSPEAFSLALQNAAGSAPAPKRRRGKNTTPAEHANAFGTNTEAENAVLDYDKLVSNCAQVARVADPAIAQQGRGAIHANAWMYVMGLVRLCENGKQRAHEISKLDPRYEAAGLDDLLQRMEDGGVGPTTCRKFPKFSPGVCEHCPHFGKISSPAQVAKQIRVVPLVVEVEQEDGSVREEEISDPPYPFVRTEHGIGIERANPETQSKEIDPFLRPYDMYPITLRYNDRTQLEDEMVWKVKLPREGWRDISIPQGTPRNQLGGALARRGVYVEDVYIPLVGKFMTLYIQKLQATKARERALTKLGWQPRDEGFALGDVLYTPDGRRESHAASDALLSATSSGIVTRGTLQGWIDAVGIYNRPHMACYRSYLYLAFGSVFYAMTGQIATLVNAMGPTGLGKSTLLDVCASIWGKPSELVVKGSNESSTRTAMEILSDAMNNLPLLIDEITDRSPDQVCSFVFNYSGGKGKIRGKANGGLRNDTAMWSNIGLMNANSDELERIASVMREAMQHVMRLMQLEFMTQHLLTKQEGDALRLSVREKHYGHAGHVFAQHIAANREKMQERVLRYVEEADKAVNAASSERFWTATVACGRLGGEVARELGLLPGWPVEDDVQWMYGQVKLLRKRAESFSADGKDIVAEYLNYAVPGTLILSQSASGNLGNISVAPKRELDVRIEEDTDMIFIAKAPFRLWCTKHRVNFSAVLSDLKRKNLLVKEEVHKVLGADTPYKSGQVRCLQVDRSKL